MSSERIKTTFEQYPSYKKACELIGLLEKNGFEAFIVGGAVRDALLGRELKDFDMATSATPDEMLKVFKGYKTLLHGVDFGTLGVVLDDENFEITTYRGESKYSDSRHPDKVSFIRSKDEDLKRRDFTINAMMFNPKSGLYDPFCGVKDLDKKCIQTVGDPSKRFAEDALRILRLFRFSIQLGFEIEEKTLEEAKKLFAYVKKVSKERIFAEIEKALMPGAHLNKLSDFLDKDIKHSFLSENLDFLEKAYLILKVSNALNVNSKNYVLSRVLSKAVQTIEALGVVSEEHEFRLSFVKALDKNLEFKESFYNILHELYPGKLIGLRLENFKIYDEKIMASLTGTLKLSLEGKSLGDKILEEKIFFLFV